MAYKYSGDAVLGVSLKVDAPKPLDIRTVVSSVEDLYNISADSAYQGMTVACVADGNIYMLIDKSQINQKTGWRASYESIEIIACTSDEYKTWKANTTEDYEPIDETQTFLHANTYYYIYEDSLSDEEVGQEYLKASWGKSIEEQLNKKASLSSVSDIQQKFSNYTTTEDLQQDYVSVIQLNEKAENYYTKSEVDEKFVDQETINNYVTKEDLKGDSDDDDFMFVTQNQYAKDKEAQQTQLDTETLNATNVKSTNLEVTDVNSETVNTKELNLGESKIVVKDNRLEVDSADVAFLSDIPNIVVLTEDEYENLLEKDEDTYYCTYGQDDIKDTGYVRSEYLLERYYTKSEVEDLIQQAIEQYLQNNSQS